MWVPYAMLAQVRTYLMASAWMLVLVPWLPRLVRERQLPLQPPPPPMHPLSESAVSYLVVPFLLRPGQHAACWPAPPLHSTLNLRDLRRRV